MQTIQSDVIVYGQDPVKNQAMVNGELSQVSPSGLDYKRRILYQGDKSIHSILVTDVHYEIDIPNLNVDGLEGWFAILALVKESIIAQGKRAGLIVLFGVERASDNLLCAIEQCLGPQLADQVRLYCWIVTSSLCSLRHSALDKCELVPVKSEGQMSRKWQYSTCHSSSKQLMTEIVKGNSASITKLRTYLYDLTVVGLTIHDIAWILLKQFVATYESRAALPVDKLEDIVSKMMHSCASASKGYRPILHLETMVVQLALTFDETL